MRVCLVAYAFYEGNARIRQYANALLARGDSVDLIALNPGTAAKFESVEGVNLYRIQSRDRSRETFGRYALQVLGFMVRSFFLLSARHFKAPYDAIHVHSVPDFLVFSAIIPKLGGVPIILDIHDILPEFYLSKFSAGQDSWFFKALVLIERLSIAFADHVIIANPIWRERLLRRSARAEKVTTIANYPESQIFFPRSRTRSDDKFILIYPGSLNWHQGLDIAIRAFSSVAEQMPHAEFWIYGEGPQRDDLVQLAADLGVSNKILFSDFVPLKEVAELMANADLAIVPKRMNSVFGTEAASTKIMECMAMGLPVIVSRTKIDTLYHNETRVRFFDSDEPDELANAILDLYLHPTVRKALAVNGLEYVAQNSWDTRKTDYLANVDRLTSHL